MTRTTFRQRAEAWFFAVSFGILALLLSSCADNPGAPVTEDLSGLTKDIPVLVSGNMPTGNGSLSGAHYNLNLIGMAKGKTADMTGGGHRIFVPLEGTTKIFLSEGDFLVVDANGTDGNGAAFRLPNPDPTNSGVTTYSVFARALGKPGGSSITTPGAYDSAGTLYLSLSSMIQVRGKGKSSFTNVSRELLYVYADIDADGDIDRVPLFDSRLQDYFWNYDNNGLKVCQLRFYEVPTTVAP